MDLHFFYHNAYGGVFPLLAPGQDLAAELSEEFGLLKRVAENHTRVGEAIMSGWTATGMLAKAESWLQEQSQR